MMLRSRFAFLLMSLAACSGAGDDDSPIDPPAPPGPSDSCGDAPPVIESVVVEDGGMYEFEQGVVYPSIMVRVEAYDEDADLTFYTLRVWWDDVVDGRVLTDGVEYREVYGTLDDDDCTVSRATVGMRLAITGEPPGSPEYWTETEFGAVIFDDEDNPSNEGVPMTAAFTTPNADGVYPE